MSTIVVVRKNQRAAIAADTLSSLGNLKTGSQYVARPDKILRFADTFMGLTGAAAHAPVLESLLRRYRKQLSFDSVGEIFESYLFMHPILKDEYFLKTEEGGEGDEYESSQIEAVICNPRGIFGMYSWREVDEYTRFWAIGSGQEYALGAMYAVYDKLEDAEEIARVGVAAGCEFDDGSGMPCTVYSVGLAGEGKAAGATRGGKRAGAERRES